MVTELNRNPARIRVDASAAELRRCWSGGATGSESMRGGDFTSAKGSFHIHKPLELREGEPRQPNKAYKGLLWVFGPY